jgi:Probable zinc-ribbon domain
MNTKIDRERWSEASKRSYAYHYQVTHYEDIHYTCSKCGSASVFAAKEQKESFEEKKNYVWQRRTLCPSCNAELFRLRQRERSLQARWSAERGGLASDLVFLREWLAVLQTIPRYSPRYRNSMSQRLVILLQRAERPVST